jgi:predicted dehydrogenase
MRVIGVALIGAGYWGKNLLRNLSQNVGFRLAHIVERKSELLPLLRAAHPHAAIHADDAAAIADPAVDAVVIATPVASHYELARRALASGKHVLVEKPMCWTSEEAAELVQRAAASGLTLMVDHTFVFHPAVTKLTELLRSGALGRISYYDSQRVNLGLFQPDVNVIWDLAPHDLSILDHLLGEEPAEVEASGYCHVNPDVPDIGYVTLHYRSRMVAHLNLSWMSPVKQRRIALGGSAKMAVWDDLDRNEPLKIYDSGITLLPQAERELIIPSYRVGDVTSPRLANIEPLAALVEHFRQVVLGRERPRTGGEHGVRVLRTIETAQRALELNLARLRRIGAAAPSVPALENAA